MYLSKLKGFESNIQEKTQFKPKKLFCVANALGYDCHKEMYCTKTHHMYILFILDNFETIYNTGISYFSEKRLIILTKRFL
jgi:hypothetical protein